MKVQQGKLTLVGAGPGDPDLISLKGIKALAEADVILYDALVDESLLNHCKPDSVRVFVGKRAGKHSLIQEHINDTIIKYASEGLHVVRLKGGDPFVFGRGYEEIQEAEAAGISTFVVPGISSSYGVATYNKLPLTSRGLSESFWVITGTTKDGRLSEDMKIAVTTSATIVVLMGFKQIAKIVALYEAHDKHDLPIAIVQNGTMENQLVATGTISTIIETSSRLHHGAPSLIIIGNVAKLLDHTSLPELSKLNNEI